MALGIISGAASLISAGADAYNAYQNNKNQKAAAKQKAANIEQARKDIDAAYSSIEKDIADYEKYVDSISVTDGESIRKYKGLVNEYDPADYTAQRGNFDKSKYDVANYVDENKAAIEQSVSDAVSRSAAGAGIGRGTGAAMDIGSAVAAKDEELTDKAYSRMKDDRAFDYTEFENQYKANQTALDNLNKNTQNQIAMLGGAINQDAQNQADLVADYINMKQGKANAKINLLT